MFSEIKEFIAGLPKAELHLHIEGTFEPELMFKIAERNKIDLKYKNVEELKKAYNFSNLQDFLDIYYEGCNVLQEVQDFYDLTWAYITKVNQQNVKHVEIMFDPQSHTDRGISFETVINGIHQACMDAKEKFGMTSGLILSFLRHLDEEAAFETLKHAADYTGWITAVGLDSSEVGHPPSKFANAFAKVKELGLKIVAHAGEEGPPAYIYEALDILKVDRIDHGNRCLEDEELVDRILKENLALTVCPLSNLKLKVVNDLKDHPLKKMIGKKLFVTINSDDPAYFGGYLNANYEEIQKALNLTKADLILLAENSFKASFLKKNEIEENLKLIKEYVDSSSVDF